MALWNLWAMLRSSLTGAYALLCIVLWPQDADVDRAVKLRNRRTSMLGQVAIGLGCGPGRALASVLEHVMRVAE